MQVCKKCKKEKSDMDFCLNKKSKTGRNYYCRLCLCRSTRVLKTKEEKENRKKLYIDRYYIDNRIRISERNKTRRIVNRDYVLLIEGNRRKSNRELYNKKLRERKKNDKIFHLRCTLSSAMSGAFNRFFGSRKPKKLEKILGVSIEVAKQHIERQFKSGMNWDNRGIGEGKWNIDHIMPLASARTKDELIVLWHYTNLQPLWSRENLSKGAKIIEHQMKIAI